MTKQQIDVGEKDNGGQFQTDSYHIKDFLKALPTVDAVEVVRCKDCTKISPSVRPVKNAVWCREFRAYMPCDGFCSYGERTTDD